MAENNAGKELEKWKGKRRSAIASVFYYYLMAPSAPIERIIRPIPVTFRTGDTCSAENNRLVCFHSAKDHRIKTLRVIDPSLPKLHITVARELGGSKVTHLQGT